MVDQVTKALYAARDQMAGELAKVARNLTPSEQLVFYQATRAAADKWLRDHQGPAHG